MSKNISVSCLRKDLRECRECHQASGKEGWTPTATVDHLSRSLTVSIVKKRRSGKEEGSPTNTRKGSN